MFGLELQYEAGDEKWICGMNSVSNEARDMRVERQHRCFSVANRAKCERARVGTARRCALARTPQPGQRRQRQHCGTCDDDDDDGSSSSKSEFTVGAFCLNEGGLLFRLREVVVAQRWPWAARQSAVAVASRTGGGAVVAAPLLQRRQRAKQGPRAHLGRPTQPSSAGLRRSMRVRVARRHGCIVHSGPLCDIWRAASFVGFFPVIWLNMSLQAHQ